MKIAASIFLIAISTGCFAQQLPNKSEIIETMKLVNDYWIENNEDPGNNKWARASYFTGNMAFYKVYKDNRYYNYALKWAELNYWTLNDGSSTRHADNQCVGQTYLDLYELHTNPHDRMLDEINESVSKMVFSEKRNDWWWVDALYMAMPVFTRLGVRNNNPGYFDKLYHLYSHTKHHRGLYNTDFDLWYRDENFVPPFKTLNNLDSYWSRGNGWVFGAHVRTLEYLPETEANFSEYLQTFQNMAKELIRYQREDGFWNVSLIDSEEYGGPETSGTAFFIYGLAWGINNGYLNYDTYMPYIIRAWQGITDIALHEDGKLGYIQGVGKSPESSQPVTFNSHHDFGVGAFLLAGSELFKLADGEAPTPPNTPRFEDYDIEYYPNPVRNQLNINNLSPGSNIVIYEFSGHKLQSLVAQDDQLSIDMNTFPAGVYFLQISKSNFKKTLKVLKM